MPLIDSTPLETARSYYVDHPQEVVHVTADLDTLLDALYVLAWRFRLYLPCASDGMPIAFELAAANVPARHVAAELPARVDLDGYTVIADNRFAGRDFEALMFDTLERQSPSNTTARSRCQA